MEVITACENVCRDFFWLPVLAQTIGGFATFGALIMAWVAYRNWRHQKVADRVSSVASDFLGELRDFEVTLMAARMRPQWPHDFDYEDANRLLGDAGRIRTQLQSKAELISALLPKEDAHKTVSDLLFVLHSVHAELTRAKECSLRGDTVGELKHLLLFFGDKILDEEMLESKRRNLTFRCEAVGQKIDQLRKRCAKLIRMET